MKLRLTGSLPLFVSMTAIGVLVCPTDVYAQASAGWEVPRTEWGHPNLQGDWSNATATPLQRAQGQGRALTWEQVAEIEGGRQAELEAGLQPSDPNRPAPPVGGDTFGLPPASVAAAGGTGGYNRVYIDRGDRVAVINGEPRSSIIIYPEDGRIPARASGAGAGGGLQALGGRAPRMGPYDHPELRPLPERCIVSFGSNAGPPMLPNGFYNNNYTIVQNEDHVMIMTEMVHDVRIIRLGDGPSLPEGIRPWFGDSWGRWEGDTLVVETANIEPRQRFQGTSENARFIERFWLMDENTIAYEFTVDDPGTFVSPWTGQLPMHRLEPGELVYEYACHEGNYALYNILSGARYQERLAAEREAGGSDSR